MNTPAAEPTPEFNQQCIAIVNRWQSGELPFAEFQQTMNTLNQEAVAAHHLANQGRVEILLGYVQSYRGNLNQAIHHYERARALFTQVENARRIAICDLNMGEAYRHKGDFKHARALFEKAYETFRDIGQTDLEAMALGNKGQMLLSIGDREGADHDLHRSCELAQKLPPSTDNRSELLCEIYHALTLLHLQNGEPEAAWDEARQALTLAGENPQPLERGFANRAAAEVLSVLEHAPENEFSSDPDSYYQAASEAFNEINAEGEIARTMFAHARSLARRGRKMTAARKLQLAMVIFSRLGMVDDAAKAAEAQLEVL